MNDLLHFWRGNVSLAKTFWLGWALPVIGGTLISSFSAYWVIENFGLVLFYISAAIVAIYAIVAVIPVWRSSGKYIGNKFNKYGARVLAVIASGIQLVSLVLLVVALTSLKFGFDTTHDEDRIAEKTAIPSETHPLAGFWKTDPNDSFGLAIAPADGNLYSVSFCGPGGCFKPGTYRPNTPLVGDEDYQVVSQDTLRVRGNDGWSTYIRVPGRGNDDCPPS